MDTINSNEPTNKRSVLIIEDDIALRKVLNDRLSDDGFITLEAENGEVGLVQALAHHPDLIILDIFMPKMDGISMLAKLRSADSWGKHVNVLVLTNSTDAQTIATVTGYGSIDFLIKSEWSLEALVARIRERLATSVPA
jgi:two-component system KDP operon response regulator KdpE